MYHAFLLRGDIVLQRVLSDPKATLAAYWPKIQSFLLWKARRRLQSIFDPQQGAAETADPERAHPELHSRDCLVDSCDYLAFLSAVEQGRAGLGMSSRGKYLSTTTISVVALDQA